MKKQIPLISLLLLISAITSLTAQDVPKDVSKLAQTIYYLNNYYLDTINFTQITDEAVSAMMKKLDPHSAFISAKDVKAMNEPLEGNFDGIGIEFAIINDSLSVQSVIPGGPSEKAGLKAGDKIVLVDSKEISGKSLNILQTHKYLRGPKGSKVNIGVLRRGNKGIIDFTIIRDKIPLNSVDASYLTNNNILYIKLSRFAATSYEEIMNVIKSLDNKPNGIILDLRGNSGGYLLAALQIANEFLARGEMILYTEGRRVPRNEEFADGTGKLQDIKTVVLIDEDSASASEIVAGALQDWDRATIVGRKSFGKGLVQQQLPLADGSQLRLTIARYHTPSGRVIQSPYEMGNTEGYYKQIIDRYKRGESFSKDSIQFPDSLKYKTLRLKRTVYGGGGIMPDIFIPADTSLYTPYYGKIVRRGIMTDYSNEYVDNNRKELLKKYPTLNIFMSKFEITEKMMQNLINYADSKGIKPVETEINISKPEINKYLEALIIRSLYGFSDFIKYLNIEDPAIIESLKIIG